MAQNGIGTRIKLSPAPVKGQRYQHRVRTNCLIPTGDIGDVLLGLCKSQLRSDTYARRTHNERIVVILQLLETSICRICCHRLTETELILAAWVSLEDVGRNERFQNEPTTNIHSEDPILGPVPGSIQWRCPKVWPSVVVERISWILHPCMQVRRTISQQKRYHAYNIHQRNCYK